MVGSGVAQRDGHRSRDEECNRYPFQRPLPDRRANVAPDVKPCNVPALAALAGSHEHPLMRDG
jgi:hypothetical protein